MSLFKKKDEKSSERTILNYPIQPMILSRHHDALLQILKSADFNEMHDNGSMSLYLRCLIAPDDEHPDSFQVFAGPKGAKANTLSPVARIPAEYSDLVRADNKKVTAGSHYWSLKATLNVFHEMHLYLNLGESKFNR